jgi:hypothetical protein
VVFWVVRGLVAAFAALAVAALFHWWGDRSKDAVRSTPLGWIDRPGGLLVGAAMGAMVASFVLLGMLAVPWTSRLADAAARSRTAHPLMTGAAATCSLAARHVPGGAWLKGRFQAASLRVEQHARVF